MSSFIYPLFVLQEKDKSNKGSCFNIDIGDAVDLNEQGYGVFWCVNMASNSKERLASNRDNVEIRFNYIDLDGNNKQLQWIKIIESPIIPTLVIETYSGFHVYWKNISGNDVETFKEVQKRLIEYFDADKACKDVLRLLRCPQFKQWKHYHKDKTHFNVDKVFSTELSYTNDDFLSTFLPSEDDNRVSIESDKESFMKLRTENKNIWSICWDKFLAMSQKELLQRLSGTEYVNREMYTFFPNSNGTEQIVVNGLSTSCFIKGNEIIADKGYGNNIFNWLRWREYNNTDKDIILILKHIVPEIFI